MFIFPSGPVSPPFMSPEGACGHIQQNSKCAQKMLLYTSGSVENLKKYTHICIHVYTHTHTHEWIISSFLGVFVLSQDWCWSWSSNTLATWCEELTHCKRPWCWGWLRAGGEGGNRGWDGWMASATQWTWVWASSGREWRTRKPDVLQQLPIGIPWEALKIP